MDFSLIFENDLKVLLPEIFLVLRISVLLIYGAVYATWDQGPQGRAIMGTSMGWLRIQVLVLASLLSFHGSYNSGSLLYGTLYNDNLTANIKGILFIIRAGSLLISLSYLRREGIYAFEYSLLLVLRRFAMGLLVSSYDLLAVYLALELQSLALYVLAAFKRGSAFSTEAGLKYFIIGAFSSGLLLFGCSLIYGFAGTTNLEDLSRLLVEDSPWRFREFSEKYRLMAGVLFLSVGMLFKLAAAPFHMWSPDVYEGSPRASTLFFSAVPKLAILGILVRLYYISFYDLSNLWQNLLISVSFCSILVAAFGALYQRRVKRFLAYSSIGHVGYILIGLSTGTLQGVQSVILYTLIYMVMTLNIWSGLLCIIPKDNSSGIIKYMDELGLVAKTNPLLGFTLGLTMFSMAGIPPLAGFRAKMYVFFAAMEGSIFGLAILAVLARVIGAFYYLRWIKIMFFHDNKTWSHLISIPTRSSKYLILIDREKSLLLGLTTSFILFFFVHPNPILLLTHRMALAICI